MITLGIWILDLMPNSFKLILWIIPAVFFISSCTPSSEKEVRVLRTLDSWQFHKGDAPDAQAIDFEDSGWATVKVSHDWAIEGPFDKEIDLQRK